MGKPSLLACTACGRPIPVGGPHWLLFERGEDYGLVYCEDCAPRTAVAIRRLPRPPAEPPEPWPDDPPPEDEDGIPF